MRPIPCMGRPSAASYADQSHSAACDGAAAERTASHGATSCHQSRTPRGGRFPCCSLACYLGSDYSSSSTPGAATRGLAKEESHAEQTASTIHPTAPCVSSFRDELSSASPKPPAATRPPHGRSHSPR